MQPRVTCLVCFTPRTGSTLLCDGLAASGLAGRPEEYFFLKSGVSLQEPIWRAWHDLQTPDYLQRVMEFGTTDNGVFSIKCQMNDLMKFVSSLQADPEFRDRSTLEVLAAFFPNPHFIWITRRDKVRQAISYVKARQNQKWMSHTTASVKWSSRPEFNFTITDQTVSEFVLQEAEWSDFFVSNAIKVFSVVYEDLVADFENTVFRALNFIGVDVPSGLSLPAPRFARQADAVSEGWVERYKARKAISIKLRQAAVVPSVIWSPSLRKAYVMPGVKNARRAALATLRRRFHS